MVKPEFRRGTTLFSAFIIALLGTIIIGTFLFPAIAAALGIFLLFAFPNLEQTIESSDPMLIIQIITAAPVIFGVLLFLLIARLFYSRQKKSNEKIVYSFYHDRLVYSEQFRPGKATITYQNIADITYSSTPSQDKWGLGSIDIITLNGSRIIRMNNIANPQLIYDDILRLIPNRQIMKGSRYENPWSGNEDFKL